MVSRKLVQAGSLGVVLWLAAGTAAWATVTPQQKTYKFTVQHGTGCLNSTHFPVPGNGKPVHFSTVVSDTSGYDAGVTEGTLAIIAAGSSSAFLQWIITDMIYNNNAREGRSTDSGIVAWLDYANTVSLEPTASTSSAPEVYVCSNSNNGYDVKGILTFTW